MKIQIFTIVALLAAAFSHHAQAEDAANINKLLKQLPGRMGKAQVSKAAAVYTATNPSAVFPAIVNLCNRSYPTDPTRAQECINDIDQSLLSKGVIAGKTFYSRYAVFPVNIEGFAVGTCLYLQSPYVLGLACYGTSYAGTGGAYAGCDIWNGCGSGYF